MTRVDARLADSKILKSKLLTIGLSTVLLAIIVCAIQVHRNFHHPSAWIVRSPANPRWAVDIAPLPSFEITQIFRVHDLKVNRFRPVAICDLYWKDRHWPSKLHWSRDGSVAAIVITFAGHRDELYGCAYDFREHKEYRFFSNGPLVPWLEVSEQIRELLAARGGVGKQSSVPDPPKAGLN